jgi:polygalacturonase
MTTSNIPPDQLPPHKHEVGAGALTESIAPVTAPFEMPAFSKPVFPALCVSIAEAGATAGVICTAQIQAAIDDVSTRGGGTVRVPVGIWKTGRISLKSHVNLHLDAGAELHFSGDVADYRPAVFTRSEGLEVMSMGACIYADDQDNIAITGKGTLVGPAEGAIRDQMTAVRPPSDAAFLATPVAERIYEGHNGEPFFLPTFISPINCRDVTIEGITLEHTAFWNIVPVYCDGVIIRGVTVNSIGIRCGDGIDIESSRNVLIEYCTLNNGDDCFTLKSGRGEDGLRVNKPTENVVIRFCLAQQGHGAITCGSETAGFIRNLYAHDCVFDNTASGIRFKARRPRGGGTENVYYERIRMNLTGPAFLWDMLGREVWDGDLALRLPKREITPLTPKVRGVTARNIVIEKAGHLIHVECMPESPLSNVLIENVDGACDTLVQAADVDGMTLRNVTVACKDPALSLLAVRNLNFENVSFVESEQ